MLEELRGGRSVTEQILQAIEDVGGEVSNPTLWGDVRRWQRQVEGFAEAYQAAQEACWELRGENAESLSARGRPEWFGPAQQMAFLQEMAANGGDANQAAYDCGTSPAFVQNLINPKSPAYNQDFADRFYMAEAHRGAKLYEKVWHHGMKEDEEGNIRQPLLLMRLAETRLPHLFNPKRTLEIEGRFHHTHELLPAEATRQIAATHRALLGPSEQTPEEALEAEYEVVEQ